MQTNVVAVAFKKLVYYKTALHPSGAEPFLLSDLLCLTHQFNKGLRIPRQIVPGAPRRH